MVTAGLRWAPLTPPATYTPSVTAKNHPNPMSSQSPLARKIVLGVAARPDWFSPATAIATTPSPNMMSTNVPKNSERYSPQEVARHPVFPRTAPAAAISVPLRGFDAARFYPSEAQDDVSWERACARGPSTAGKRETAAASSGTSYEMRDTRNELRERVGRGATRLKESSAG